MNYKKIVFDISGVSKNTEPYIYYNTTVENACRVFLTESFLSRRLFNVTDITYTSDETLTIFLEFSIISTNHVDIFVREVLLNDIDTMINVKNAPYTVYGNKLKVISFFDKLNKFIKLIYHVSVFLIDIALMIVFLPFYILYFIGGIIQMIYKVDVDKKLKQTYFGSYASSSYPPTFEKFKQSVNVKRVYRQYDYFVWLLPVELIAAFILNSIFPQYGFSIILLCIYIFVGNYFAYNIVLNNFKKYDLV